MRLRLSGVLLHISSLPSRYGIGDLGPEAHSFARLLARSGQSVWQFLPLTPTSPGIGNSPYSSPSAFAGNMLFISPEQLEAEGFVSQADIDAANAETGFFTAAGERAIVDYERVGAARRALLNRAFDNSARALETDASFKAFTEANGYWLEEYARFVTIKDAQGGAPWTAWPEPLARRHAEALADWDRSEARAMQRERFIQYLFYRQWERLRSLCSRLSLRLIGDAPIYVTHDSADVWAHPGFFRLDGTGNPTVVAGVPPDYFSPTGQRWGNPLYDWNALAADGFQWWTRRLEHNLRLFDCVRLDHFRGFAGYWEVPASEATAVNGRWVDAPGGALFTALARRLLSLPLIAEDLGVITPDVRELQRNLGFPGMAVLQFGFAGDLRENPHTPFMHKAGQVVYTGTHDNAPVRGWFMESASWEEKSKLAAYVGHEVTGDNAARTLLRLALASVADMAVAPAQDILDLPMAARMNTPSTVANNWVWRLEPGQFTAESMAWFSENAAFFGRHAGSRE
ncbi:MAG: 4-alpha-glucanotransferase [Deltaproteobacteria bacterium]|jgi:4-alpha-glucanotransferase|nr:4-alpha-glucanotransferase [Deltaproteobacteria bacterium]